MRKWHAAMTVALVCLACWTSSQARRQEPLALENGRLRLSFDRKTGTLVAIHNKLAGETYQVQGDEFEVEAVEFRVGSAGAKLASLDHQRDAVLARYEADGMTVEVTYSLRGENHFAEKRVTLTSTRKYGLKKVALSRPTFAAPGLQIVPYRYPKFKRPPGTEPIVTYFGRTPRGGLFTGIEMPFDASSTRGQEVVLAYAPSLKVAAGRAVPCEPVYFGVYRRQPSDREQEALPLGSESDAIVAMTSAVLGPPRHGLVPMACGWHCEMEHGEYTEQSVEGDMKSLDFLARCAVDWVSDSHPWGGETRKMNALGADDKYEPGPLVEKFLEHARKVDVKVVMWSSMNKTHAWSGLGRPFRSDKPDWLIDAGAKPPEGAPAWRKKASGVLSSGGNCFANRPLFDWLVRINLKGMAAGRYKSWAMDGDFFGGGGWYTTVVPVDCQSDKHDHLPGDSNYACQKALDRLMATVREHYPDTYIFTCRPPMDLGVWSLRNVDACFTLLESGTGKDNLASGDHIRTWSRVRVHRDFFPHYMDQPLLFPSRAGGAGRPGNWPRGHLDYILLSALSSSPNQLFYLPTKTGIPEADQAEIRKWLDWGRKHVAYLKVRKDLPDWPAAGKVDGSAHVVDGRGLVFLFNPGKQPLSCEFQLTEESIGLKQKGPVLVTQSHPPSDRSLKAAYGQTVRWEVPPETALILEVNRLAGQ